MDRTPTQPLSPPEQADLLRRGSPYRRPIVALGFVIGTAAIAVLVHNVERERRVAQPAE